MKATKKKAEDGLYKYSSLFKGTRDILYSYDNPRIHESAADLLERAGISPADRVPLPPYSPDMHKVIEHAHSNLQQIFKQMIRDNSNIKTPVGYEYALRRAAKQLSKESIARDVQSLPETYKAIIKEGGKWPAKKFR